MFLLMYYCHFGIYDNMTKKEKKKNSENLKRPWHPWNQDVWKGDQNKLEWKTTPGTDQIGD